MFVIRRQWNINRLSELLNNRTQQNMLLWRDAWIDNNTVTTQEILGNRYSKQGFTNYPHIVKTEDCRQNLRYPSIDESIAIYEQILENISRRWITRRDEYTLEGVQQPITKYPIFFSPSRQTLAKALECQHWLPL